MAPLSKIVLFSAMALSAAAKDGSISPTPTRAVAGRSNNRIYSTLGPDPSAKALVHDGALVGNHVDIKMVMFSQPDCTGNQFPIDTYNYGYVIAPNLGQGPNVNSVHSLSLSRPLYSNETLDFSGFNLGPAQFVPDANPGQPYDAPSQNDNQIVGMTQYAAVVIQNAIMVQRSPPADATTMTELPNAGKMKRTIALPSATSAPGAIAARGVDTSGGLPACARFINQFFTKDTGKPGCVNTDGAAGCFRLHHN
ncbi:MAG: hypothetical protein OHK93_000156 [Ramalina farinacea]|uniref:Uncharacterized protein n=1 Tax=Ramalina farinacea TaxID=258253 RepID=A0AA43QEB3_9LECA|nr:hypothetical protein [Ramalina farinacea]